MFTTDKIWNTSNIYHKTMNYMLLDKNSIIFFPIWHISYKASYWVMFMNHYLIKKNFFFYFFPFFGHPFLKKNQIMQIVIICLIYGPFNKSRFGFPLFSSSNFDIQNACCLLNFSLNHLVKPCSNFLSAAFITLAVIICGGYPRASK